MGLLGMDRSRNDPIDDTVRWAILSGSRFVLSCIVLVGHMSAFDPAGHSWTKIGVYLNQGSAVYGFLIISGYSIAASLERGSTGFYGRRFWRIFPTYFASIVAACFVGALIGDGLQTPSGFRFDPISPCGVAIALFMLQSFVGPTISTDGQLWTIAVEWWNYIISPIFNKISSIFMAILMGVSLLFYCRWGNPENPALSKYGHMFLTLSWYWIIGFIYYRHRRTPWGYAILFLPIMFVMNQAWVGRAAMIGIASVALCDEIRIPGKWIAPLTWLGELSYPVYAMHVPVIVLFVYLKIDQPSWAVAATLVLSAVVLHSIDLPLRAWGYRLGKSRRRQAIA